MRTDYWKTERLLLRVPTPADVALFQAFDDEVSRNLDMVYLPQSEDRQARWLEGELKPKLDDSYRLVAETHDGALVGTINTFACHRRNRTFKYGIALLPEFRSQGYAAEMIERVVRYYFHELNYQKATPHVYSFNRASIRLHEKMGFVREGTLRSMVYSNGEYHDEIYFGMTKREFDERYGKSVFF
ncbi:MULTISPECIES: GNAT family N-acetyltransferase [Cohnella]|uniref:GNAT family N-acetyltransferase n=1 Tax=Cohnella TaxID=329857 RepID=UPI0009BA5E65|nr:MULTISPECIES: GNAT family protein [Cohnella]MBN2981365.1 GNAT family N-acetyltransferase [Cohnella algarum]